MHSGVPIFRVGDMVLVGFSKDKKLRAQIVNFRAQPLDPRTPRQTYGCDVITEELRVTFYALEQIVEWNPHKVKEWFK